MGMLPKLVANSFAEYEALAIKLAAEPPLLQPIKQKLQRNRLSYPLFDTDRFIKAAYINMWESWQPGESPRSFSVEPVLTDKIGLPSSVRDCTTA
jgi:hypothetical protein